ncbi:MAG: hypothetical protein B7X65_13590 [Polaromonas sp. 39-63-25]|nr:MAG: hypothetical protein B7Y60_15240 [Polaromonas sp. 35-63-35]OYZ19322.1 MAG: hypothetical protein B7Y28_12350 [Polaromonas sp. 16-63-31]OYZ77552.1 MAG: hypothetical protein B7Y09_16400 [Polaromonas sp. 24-63-21]OZA48465.1 MAG: hypothetical protein B7X88_18120 [Polaromonas sp. 17-63-33]OZA87213.1 MAG: hypothetical protein B7X65_13590 [Polaromonas sp. 39-63-25]
MSYSGRDAVGGAVRGAGSVGSTLLAPFDYGEEALGSAMGMPANAVPANTQRRRDIDAGLTSAIGSNPESTPYKTTKLLAEIGGSSGAGGLVSNLIAKIPGAATAIPGLLDAISTGGMSASGYTGAGGLATRVAGGAVNGAVTAGIVNPQDAPEGMMIGGGFPVATKLAGEVGGAIGGIFGSKVPPVNPTKLQTAKESMDAGYVIPPNMIKPTFKNSVIESISGKQATQQFASTKNTEVTEKLTRQALGIADDIPLTRGTMDDLRKTAGKAYADVSSLSPQAATDLEALKVARNESQGWFNAYNRSASPDDLVKAKAARQLSDQLETALENHAKTAGKDELIPALRAARKQIAKTYTVSRALNDASGTVDARVFGRLYEKGKPLSDGLDTAGRFASAFPKAAMTPQQVGSPGAHNLKAGLAAAMSAAGSAGGVATGMGGVATGGLGLALGAVPFVAPPMARSIMFSKGAQQGLLNQGGGPGLLSNTLDEALPLMYRTNPLLAQGLIGQ